MLGLTVPLLTGATTATAETNAQGRPNDDAARARDAAQQFEALLLAQMLRMARAGSGWGQTDSAAQGTTDFAEQQFALVLAQQGGVGLAAQIATALQAKPHAAPGTRLP